MTTDTDRAAVEVMARALFRTGAADPDQADAISEISLAALRDAGFWVDRWRPIGEIEPFKESGEPILVRFHADLPARTGREDLERWNGKVATVRHAGFYNRGDGTRGDLDWNIVGPVGYGGLPDEWFECFMPLPPPPKE